jgi:hypothetical protein
MDFKNEISEAIKMRKKLSFIYKGGIRIVEPFLLGYHKDTGNLTLRAFFTDGFSKSGNYNSWKLYTVEEIQNLKTLSEEFSGEREYYNPEDKMMSSIVARL